MIHSKRNTNEGIKGLTRTVTLLYLFLPFVVSHHTFFLISKFFSGCSVVVTFHFTYCLLTSFLTTLLCGVSTSKLRGCMDGGYSSITTQINQVFLALREFTGTTPETFVGLTHLFLYTNSNQYYRCVRTVGTCHRRGNESLYWLSSGRGSVHRYIGDEPSSTLSL